MKCAIAVLRGTSHEDHAIFVLFFDGLLDIVSPVTRWLRAQMEKAPVIFADKAVVLELLNLRHAVALALNSFFIAFLLRIRRRRFLAFVLINIQSHVHIHLDGFGCAEIHHRQFAGAKCETQDEREYFHGRFYRHFIKGSHPADVLVCLRVHRFSSDGHRRSHRNCVTQRGLQK